MSGSRTIVMGVDPGLHSFGACLYDGERVVSWIDQETKASQRKGQDPHRWVRLFTDAVDEAKPHALGLEDYEPQPWRTGGKVPRGAVSMQELVSLMRAAAQKLGTTVYTQSPKIQADYPDAAILQLLRTSGASDPSPHLVSACKHALYAHSTYVTNGWGA